MSTSWYEFEERVGRWWHGWASAAASYPRFPEAAVSLDEVQTQLGPYFRMMGGTAGLTLARHGGRNSGHRLSWRQRLGLDQEPVIRGECNQEQLLLPDRIEHFPVAELNRDCYFWLCAYLANARPLPSSPCPFQQDLLALHQAHRISRQLCSSLPGLAWRYERLCRALLDIRPLRRLPALEARVEALVLGLLGAQLADDESLSPLMKLIKSHGNDLSSGLGQLNQQVPAGYRRFLPVFLWGWSDLRPDGQAAQDNDEPPGEQTSEDGDTLQRRAERRYLDQTERDDPLLLNPFEKMLSWTEMVNVNRMVEDDDPDDARKAAEQLDQLTLSRHRRKAATRLKMQLELGCSELASGAVKGDYLYPEWHYRKRGLLKDYIAVEAGPTDDTVASDWQITAELRTRIRQVQRQFEALRAGRTLLRAQFDGPDLDLDAVIRARSDSAAGCSPATGLYQDWRVQERDLAVALLVDVSLSTDAWIEDRQVIEVEKEAVLVLAHGLAACDDPFAIHSFTSRKRRVELRTVKGFTERMGPAVEKRIGALRPGQYTRMGPAIRHMGYLLGKMPQRHRLLLVLSDGKPNDIDHYEGRYALEDTRHAIRGLRREGMSVFGVTIDERARDYVPLLFGPGGYSIVTRPAGLATALPRIYRQIIAD